MQHNENANPPTLFLALESLMTEMERQGTTVRNALHLTCLVLLACRDEGFIPGCTHLLCLVRVRQLETRVYMHTLTNP